MKQRTIKRQFDYDLAYMRIAEAMSSLSYAKRAQVGAIIVSPNDQIIAQGYNGMPNGWDNDCETKEYNTADAYCRNHCKSGQCSDCNDAVLVSKPEVLHAESNAIAKCAMSSNSTLGATLYVTTSPCFDCAKMIVQSGIKRVVFKETYRKKAGIVLMIRSGVTVQRIINDSVLEELSIGTDNVDVMQYDEHVIDKQMLYSKVI